MKHCCEDMQEHVNHKCDKHENIYDCPDNLIVYNEKKKNYGIIIHDGGSSSIEIDWCPWCGSSLKIL